MEDTLKSQDIKNGEPNTNINVPHGDGSSSIARDHAQIENEKIEHQIDPCKLNQTEATSEQSSANSVILSEEPANLDSTETVKADGNALPSTEISNEDVAIVDFSKQTELDIVPTAVEKEESKPSELIVLAQPVEISNETLSLEDSIKEASVPACSAPTSTMEVVTESIEASNSDVTVNECTQETILAASIDCAKSMDVEEQTDIVISTVAASDTIAPASANIEDVQENNDTVQDHGMPPPAAPVASTTSMEVEEPAGSVSSTATIQDQVAEQQQLESEAVQKINASSLSLLCQYSGSSESESEDTDVPKSEKHISSSSSDESEDEKPRLSRNYRKCEDAILVSDAETMDTNAASSDEDDEEHQKQGPIRTKGEILVDELPPIEELTITVPETECKPIGLIDSIVAQIVLVQSIPGVELLNLETVLFLDRGKRPLGKIYDVIGQVNRPIYCVLFNSNYEVVSRNITVGMEVFCAPRTEHTSFIILSELMRYKGSDASWMNDNEPPAYMVEYSDDEEEKAAKRNRKKKPNENDEQTGENSQQPKHHQQQPQPRYPNQQQQQYPHQQQQPYPHPQQFPQSPYMPRQQFRRPPPNNRGNFYPHQPSGYSWHHNVHNPRYNQPQQYHQRHQQPYRQQQYPQQQHQQYHQQHHQQQRQQQQFEQLPNAHSAPGPDFLPNPFAVFGQQPPNPPS